jgi:hypothetical protein
MNDFGHRQDYRDSAVHAASLGQEQSEGEIGLNETMAIRGF